MGLGHSPGVVFLQVSPWIPVGARWGPAVLRHRPEQGRTHFTLTCEQHLAVLSIFTNMVSRDSEGALEERSEGQRGSDVSIQRKLGLPLRLRTPQSCQFHH